jgi:hypothetical protein
MQSDSESSDDDPNFDSNAEDEEINEEQAFSKEDQAKFGAWFGEDTDDDDPQEGEGYDAIGEGPDLSSDGPDNADADEWLQGAESYCNMYGVAASAHSSPLQDLHLESSLECFLHVLQEIKIHADLLAP